MRDAPSSQHPRSGNASVQGQNMRDVSLWPQAVRTLCRLLTPRVLPPAPATSVDWDRFASGQCPSAPETEYTHLCTGPPLSDPRSCL